MGDPAGIGPDVTLCAWALRHERDCPVFFAIGDPAVYAARAAMLPGAAHLRIQSIGEPEEAAAAFAKALPVLPLKASIEPVLAGVPNAANAPAVIESIEQAVALTIEGRASAVVTAPIAKHVLMARGFAHAGHTEFLAELAARHNFPGAFPVMLMASRRLMALPVTVHIALKDVAAALTKDRLVRTAEVTHEGLARYFSIAKPRLAICGLNPHAGEEGVLGREEIETIAPAIADSMRAASAPSARCPPTRCSTKRRGKATTPCWRCITIRR